MLPQAVGSQHSIILKKGVKDMWIDTRNYVPIADGFYLVQTVFNEIDGLKYTLKGGWNTSYDRHGNLDDDHAVPNTYVARWYEAEKPQEVPQEWTDEHLKQFYMRGGE